MNSASKKHFTLRRLFIGCLLFLSLWIFLARCVILQNRWGDAKAEQIFENKNIPLEIHDTLISNHHLHYALTGIDTLATLVFIHGSPGSWMNYAAYLWDPLLRKKFRMVSIDRPGFGYSDFGQALHLQDQAKIILPVLRSLKNNQPMLLCGHSMGGPVAVELAALDTALFHTIIIASGALDVQEEKKETWRRVMAKKPLSWLLPGAFAPSNTELLFLKEDLVPLQKSFGKITCNVHFIHGDRDSWVPIENISYGKKMMTHAGSLSADTIKGAGHLIPWKNKEEFTRILYSVY